MPGDASRQNGKLGGRPKGSKNPQTIEKEAVMRELRDRIMRSADSIFNAAKSTALGNSFLYKIETYKQNGKKIRSKPIRVENPEEIANYIDHLENGASLETGDDTYYYVTTREPNIQAIKELWDRAFGRPKESLEVEGKDGGPIQVETTLKTAIEKIYGNRPSGG